MSTRRLWPVLLLVPLGTVTGHQVVYASLHTHASGVTELHSHGHLGPLTTLALPLALVGAAWLARRANRDLILPALAVLSGVQVLAFTAMEAAERMVAGGELAALVRSPLLWMGLAVQVAIALTFVLTLRGAGTAACVLLLRNTTAIAPAPRTVPAPRPTGQHDPRPLAVTGWLFQRGPPDLLGP